MTKSQIMGARLGLALLGAGMVLAAAPAGAQTGNPALDDPRESLSRNLRSLAENPRSLAALIGAGKAALELGDPHASITFFGRAEEQAPRDGRVKMWIGASLVQLKQAQGALKFFGEAVSLGAPQAEVAAARGLAYDLLGDSRRAQADYRMALQHKHDAEVTRRLALSLAISGEREPALQLLETQLMTRDRAAERTRAFVLALTGDAPAATRAVQASLPAQAAALSPFLERLPALTPSERAMAVHFGDFPRHGRNLPVPPANSYAAARSASPTGAGAPDSRQTALGTRKAAPGTQTAARQVATRWEPRTTRPAPEREPVRTAAASAAQKPAAQTPAAAKPEPARERQAGGAPGGGNPAWAWTRGVASARRTEAEKPPATIAQLMPRAAAPATQSSVAAAAQPQPQTMIAAAAPAPAQSAPQRAQPAFDAAAPALTLGAAQQPLVEAQAPGHAPVQVASNTAPSVLGDAPGFSISNPVQSGLVANPAASAAAGSANHTSSQPAATTPAPNQFAALEAPQPAPAPVEERGASRLAGIASLIATLPETAPEDDASSSKAEPAAQAPTAAPRTQVPAATAKQAPAMAAKQAPIGTAAKKEAPAKPAAAAKKPAPAPAEPSRIWVQVAGGADKAALPRELARLKAKAPKLLSARTGWTTPLKATNRLLVGPFKTDKEAQDFVNELNKADLSGFAWTSAAGQKIEKLGAK